jgi:hypothetical protein
MVNLGVVQQRSFVQKTISETQCFSLTLCKLSDAQIIQKNILQGEHEERVSQLLILFRSSIGN